MSKTKPEMMRRLVAAALLLTIASTSAFSIPTSRQQRNLSPSLPSSSPSVLLSFRGDDDSTASSRRAFLVATTATSSILLIPSSSNYNANAAEIAEQKEETITTSPEDVQRMLTALMRWRGGVLVKCFALAYFAGIRPDGELKRLAARASELVNLRTRVINVPASVSKTKEARQVTISENLAAWLEAFSAFPIIPTNFDRLMKKARAHFGISHDETRHSFISYHVALNRSVGDAALQAGNSESIVKKHYLNTHPREEGERFFSLTPDVKKRRALEAKSFAKPSQDRLKAI